MKKINRVGEKHITNQGQILTIIHYTDYHNCVGKFEDGVVIEKLDYGAILKGNISNPLYKSIYSVGYLGFGEYSAHTHRRMYNIWASMVGRCYSKNSQIVNPTYNGCTVIEEWKCFQDYAKWYEKNYNAETMKGWHLDKDILVKGNKIYSPETCCFVPQEINILFIRRNRNNKLPIGVYPNHKRFSAKLNNTHLGTFDTPEEAFQAYKTAKEEYIKEVADKWKDLIDLRVYQAMYNYKVEIND